MKRDYNILLKIMRKLIYTLVILAFVSSVSAQWTQLSSGTDFLKSVCVTDVNTVYYTGFNATTTSTICNKTTNGGVNWFQFIASNLVGGACVYFINADTGFLSSPITMTTNAGSNWTIVWYSTSDTTIIWGIHFPNPTIGYGVGFVYSQNQAAQTVLVKTTNGGINWTRLAPPISGTGKQLLDVFFTDANTGYCIGRDSVVNIFLKTTNGGNNWSSIVTGVGSEGYSIFFTGPNTGYICGQGGIQKTTNAGVSWFSSYNNTMKDLYFINANTGYAVGGDGIVMTNNAGANWTVQNSSFNDLRSIMFYGTYSGYAVGNLGVVVKTTNGGIGITNISTEIPASFSLSQNYPNPFNPSTKFKVDIVKLSNVTIKVFDVLGREIAILVNQQLNAGTYEVNWNASTSPSGVYFYRLVTEGYSETKKMVLTK